MFLITVTSAILWLAPYIDKPTAKEYAHIIVEHSGKRSVNPYLVVATIHRESRFVRTRVSRRNYGLMQVRVSRTTNPDLIGQEWLLLLPEKNIATGIEMLAYWKRYHRRQCKDDSHPWWSHYQWGNRVRGVGSGRRVGRIYRILAKKFGSKPSIKLITNRKRRLGINVKPTTNRTTAGIGVSIRDRRLKR